MQEMQRAVTTGFDLCEDSACHWLRLARSSGSRRCTVRGRHIGDRRHLEVLGDIQFYEHMELGLIFVFTLPAIGLFALAERLDRKIGGDRQLVPHKREDATDVSG
jgi:hypothetical protein